MEKSIEKFDFHATVDAVWQALFSVTCHILFDFALVGLGIATFIGACAFVFKARQHRFARPFTSVAIRLGSVCLGLAVPGLVCLVFTGKLPDSGVYGNNCFLGFLVFWSMVTIYLLGEEMNYQWFDRKGLDDNEVEDPETYFGDAKPEPEVNAVVRENSHRTEVRESAVNH
ncbi:MAG: hypothetical protein K2X93_29145 [Candidatus Obscuribacterales bacterium]|nr:hypothetical protein [Candidatus Obscuribacterales bacterium]